MSRGWKYGIVLTATTVLLFATNLVVGSVHIPVAEVLRIMSGGEGSKDSWEFILWEARLPQALTALLCGGALSACGLLLQTVFKNPLAGVSILGVSTGASLGVALVMLMFGGSVITGAFSISGFVSVLTGAFAGAMAVMSLLLFLSAVIRNGVMLLVAGIMIAYLVSSAISLLNYFATAEGVQSYMTWGLGNFGGVPLHHIPAFASLMLLGIFASLLLVKPLNALLLGERYAENLGIRVHLVRNAMLLVTGMLTAISTAYCGPVLFIDLAVPHIARLMLGTDNHNTLLPITIITGSAVALLCNLLCVIPGDTIMPLNAVTPLVGAPVVLYVILKWRNISRLH